MEFTLFKDFSRKIPRPAPPTGRPGRAQSGRTPEFFSTGPYRSSMYLWYFKEALNNIVKFSFWLDIIYQVKLIANLQVQKKKNQKIPSQKKKYKQTNKQTNKQRNHQFLDA